MHLVFEDSSPQFRAIFGSTVFGQLMDRAMTTLPPIPPQSHSLSPLSESHLLKIELLRLATVVLNSIPENSNSVDRATQLAWLLRELKIHTNDSQQYTYPIMYILLHYFHFDRIEDI